MFYLIVYDRNGVPLQGLTARLTGRDVLAHVWPLLLAQGWVM